MNLGRVRGGALVDLETQMGRVHHVKKARKDNKAAGIKKGQEYWWVAHKTARGGFKRYFHKRPRPSQCTQSEFYSALYELQERMEDAAPASMDDLASLRDEWASRAREIGEDQQSKFDNMPDGLQQGTTGQLLEDRASAMDGYADEIENVDCELEEGDESEDEQVERALDEIRNVSCDA